MIETIKEALGLFDAIPVEAWVLALGIIFGTGATHFIKRNWLPAHYRIPRVIEGINVILTTAPVARFWPGGFEAGVYVGLSVGVSVVVLYKPVMRWAYQRWPELEQKMSAVRIKTMADGELGIKVDEDATRALTPQERKELGLPERTTPKTKKPKP